MLSSLLQSRLWHCSSKEYLDPSCLSRSYAPPCSMETTCRQRNFLRCVIHNSNYWWTPFMMPVPLSPLSFVLPVRKYIGQAPAAIMTVGLTCSISSFNSCSPSFYWVYLKPGRARFMGILASAVSASTRVFSTTEPRIHPWRTCKENIPVRNLRC